MLLLLQVLPAAASMIQEDKNILEAAGQITEKFNQELGDKTTRDSMSTAAIALGMNALTGGDGDVNSLVSRATGNIVNPNVELLFNGVQLRGGFNFIYDLIPRNQTESESIKNIIRTFKQQMLPNKRSTGFFIKAPNVFRLKYMRGGGVHPFLNLFKICALTNMSVDYSGSGTYASYHDATPVHMVLNLQFQELSPIYREDYDSPAAQGGSWLLMSYFRELPNVRYQSFLSDKNSSQEYILVKNIFRRAKIRDDLQNVFTLFNKYEIEDGMRPDLVAREVYGSTEYDWVVITTSGITNMREE